MEWERGVLRGACSVRNELNYYANVTSVRKCFPLCVCVCVQYINKTLENLCRGQDESSRRRSRSGREEEVER